MGLIYETGLIVFVGGEPALLVGSWTRLRLLSSHTAPSDGVALLPGPPEPFKFSRLAFREGLLLHPCCAAPVKLSCRDRSTLPDLVGGRGYGIGPLSVGFKLARSGKIFRIDAFEFRLLRDDGKGIGIAVGDSPPTFGFDSLLLILLEEGRNGEDFLVVVGEEGCRE